MATKKKAVKMRDLKPAKDAKGGVARQSSNRTDGQISRPGRGTTALTGPGRIS